MRIERAIESRISVEATVSMSKLVSLLIKKDEALEVRDRLKRMPSLVTTMPAELAITIQRTTDRYIIRVTLPDGQQGISNVGIGDVCRSYYQELFMIRHLFNRFSLTYSIKADG